MTRQQALSQGREIFQANNIEDAFLESEILLRHVLELNRAQFYLDIEDALSQEQAEAYWHLIERRRGGEPTAYITGHREFYGREFYVDTRVLIPRPESELLVEKALCLARKKPIATVADIGTGCGAIAVSLALNLAPAKVYATDVSGDALEVAGINGQRHGVADKICLRRGDLLEPLPEPVDLIIANLPYVQESTVLEDSSLSFEPSLALDGGPAGVEIIRRLCRQVSGKLNPGGCLLLEIGQGQRAAVSRFLGEFLPDGEIEIDKDLGGIERVVSLCLTS
ncbi:MAG: peptide chain release factor N(5)-glutamine methyltransferase [Dehalococcoidales bacterium]